MVKSEFDLIRHYFKQQTLHRDDVVLGIGDDAAVVNIPRDHQLVVTTDTLVAGQHFLPDADPCAIGHKALAANLSDLAAMGATPTWCSLALTLPELDEEWLTGFCAGFYALATKHQVQLIGGDMTKGPLSLTLTLHGVVPSGKAIRRDGAQVGDKIYVTGTLGESAAGLAIILDQNQPHTLRTYSEPHNSNAFEDEQELVAAHYFATPRVSVGEAVRQFVSAGIDISDGLAADLQHILKASGVGARLDLEKLPMSARVKQRQNDLHEAIKLALGSGEEYELCLIVPSENQTAFEQTVKQTQTPITCIGDIDSSAGLNFFLDNAPCDWRVSGWDHFVDKDK